MPPRTTPVATTRPTPSTNHPASRAANTAVSGGRKAGVNEPRAMSSAHPEGSIVLNGARIGRHSIVGAGALVTEGKEFPDNSLIVGSPARAVRTLDEKAFALIAGATDFYVGNSRRFAGGLVRVG